MDPYLQLREARVVASLVREIRSAVLISELKSDRLTAEVENVALEVAQLGGAAEPLLPGRGLRDPLSARSSVRIRCQDVLARVP
jgi:hypothetical protein